MCLNPENSPKSDLKIHERLNNDIKAQKFEKESETSERATFVQQSLHKTSLCLLSHFILLSVAVVKNTRTDKDTVQIRISINLFICVH
jgi:hypothetical protein